MSEVAVMALGLLSFLGSRVRLQDQRPDSPHPQANGAGPDITRRLSECDAARTRADAVHHPHSWGSPSSDDPSIGELAQPLQTLIAKLESLSGDALREFVKNEP